MTELTMHKLAAKLKKSRPELNRILSQKYQISQPAIFYWWEKRIPSTRQIQLVRDFNLDPKILIK